MSASKVLPGPWGLPWLGNFLQIDSANPYATFEKWAKEFGDVYAIKVPGKQIVVLSSEEAVREASETRAPDFDSRQMTYRGDFISNGGTNIILAPYGDRLVCLRKIAIAGITKFDTGTEKVEELAGQLAKDLLSEVEKHMTGPYNPTEDVNNALFKAIFVMIFGDVISTNSDLFKLTQDILQTSSDILSPEGDTLDKFPWIRYFCNTTYKKIEHQLELREQFIKEELPKLKDSLDPGHPRGLLDYILLAQDHEGRQLDDATVTVMMTDCFVGGKATSSKTILSLINILLHYPDVQKKLHEEAETVLTASGSATLRQLDSLHYTRAAVLETLRYAPPVRLGVPRKTIRQTHIKGYPIPEETVVLYNVWRIHHDPEVWSDPEVFRPERFLDGEGKLVPIDHPNRKRLFPFGAGGRKCIGYQFALNRMYLLVSALSLNFQFSIPEGGTTVSCDPRTYDGREGVTGPGPFEVNVTKWQ